MSNLSKIKRDKLKQLIDKIKEDYKENDEMIIGLFELEKELLSKKYGLVWEEHKENIDYLLEDNIPAFLEKYKLLHNKKRFNFLLEGDNLHSLYLLDKTNKGKIDIIYIDPPYNTGQKDFMYNDEYVDKEDSFKHSKWLSFMHKRLSLARGLLSEDGIIFISIKDNEMAELKLLCNEIFGEENFINLITVNMNSLSGVKMKHAVSGKRYPGQKEYILFYRKKDVGQKFNIDKIEKDTWDKEYNMIIPEMTESFINELESMEVDEINKELSRMNLMTLNEFGKINKLKINDEWKHANSYRIFGSKSNRPLVSKLKNQNFNQVLVCYINQEGNKRFFKSDYNKDVKDPRIELVQAKSNSSVFLSDNWTDISNDGGVAQEGGVSFPNGKKPLSLIKRILNTSLKKDAIILDFFAGSGTTGEAVMELNMKDNGSRTYILCTNNEKNICEKITYKRLTNVQKRIPHNLKYFETTYIQKNNNEKIQQEIMDKIKHLIELEFRIDMDNNQCRIILTDEEANDLEEVFYELDKLESIFISNDVLLTSKQEKLFNTKKLVVIPDFYFGNELREIGEIW